MIGSAFYWTVTPDSTEVVGSDVLCHAYFVSSGTDDCVSSDHHNCHVVTDHIIRSPDPYKAGAHCDSDSADAE